MVDKTKESLKVKFDDYSVYHDQDDKLDLVVAVHAKLGPNLTNNNTFQGLVGLRVPQLQKKDLISGKQKQLNLDEERMNPTILTKADSFRHHHGISGRVTKSPRPPLKYFAYFAHSAYEDI